VTEIMTNQNTVYSTYTLYIPVLIGCFCSTCSKVILESFMTARPRLHNRAQKYWRVSKRDQLQVTYHDSTQTAIKTLSKIRCSGRITNKVLVFKCDFMSPSSQAAKIQKTCDFAFTEHTCVVFHWKDLKKL